MKISLVQLPTSHHGAGEKVFPLGLSRLSSLVPPAYTKSALDMNLFPDPWPELKMLIEEKLPDIVAFSLRNIDPLAGHLVSYLASLKTAVALVRTILPKSRILVGGPAFSLFGSRLMEAVPEIDYGLVGEGEGAFPAIIGKEIGAASVPGLLWRKDGVIRQNPPGQRIDLDKIPAMDTGHFRSCGLHQGKRLCRSCRD